MSCSALTGAPLRMIHAPTEEAWEKEMRQPKRVELPSFTPLTLEPIKAPPEACELHRINPKLRPRRRNKSGKRVR